MFSILYLLLAISAAPCIYALSLLYTNIEEDELFEE